MFLAPASMQSGVMIAGMVGDHDHPPRSGGAGAIEVFQKDKESGAVELVGLAVEK